MTPAERLSWNMKVTSACRFHAHARLEKKVRLFQISLVTFSTILIVVSIIALTFPMNAQVNKTLGVIGLIFSVILVVISASDRSYFDAVRGERLYKCTTDIAKLKRQFDSFDRPSEQIMLDFSSRYDDILEKSSVNHDDSDFRRYQLDHPEEFRDLRDAGSGNIAARRVALASRQARTYYIVILVALTLVTVGIVWDLMGSLHH